MSKTALVNLILGSKGSDLDVVRDESKWYEIMEAAGIDWQLSAASAHRNNSIVMPALNRHLETMWNRGTRIFVAFVGLKPDLGSAICAALPGAEVYVVPRTTPNLGILDPAGSVLSMPPGVPMGCYGVNGIGLTNTALAVWLSIVKFDEDRLAEYMMYKAANYCPEPELDIPIIEVKKPEKK